MPNLQPPSYSSDQPYVGRFAPSPSGDLHFGSLVAAVVSYLEAKTRQGKWLLRIEDIDEPRSSSQSAKSIINDLDKLGFEYDDAIEYQSKRHEHYQKAIDALLENRSAYFCNCSRKKVAEAALKGKEGWRYPGWCRSIHQPPAGQYSIKFNVDGLRCAFNDQLQGELVESLNDYGDFALKRADGYFSYQLAVVVDDYLQGVTDVVRGYDLIGSTTRQIALQSALGYSLVNYCHFPTANNPNGQKLSKQNLALAIQTSAPTELLFTALCWLKQNPPKSLKRSSLSTLWEWALDHWDISQLAALTSQLSPTKFSSKCAGAQNIKNG